MVTVIHGLVEGVVHRRPACVVDSVCRGWTGWGRGRWWSVGMRLVCGAVMCVGVGWWTGGSDGGRCGWPALRGGWYGWMGGVGGCGLKVRLSGVPLQQQVEERADRFVGKLVEDCTGVVVGRGDVLGRNSARWPGKTSSVGVPPSFRIWLKRSRSPCPGKVGRFSSISAKTQPMHQM